MKIFCNVFYYFLASVDFVADECVSAANYSTQGIKNKTCRHVL